MNSNITISSYLLYMVLIMSGNFYFLQGRSENHFYENAPCLKIIIIITMTSRIQISKPKGAIL